MSTPPANAQAINLVCPIVTHDFPRLNILYTTLQRYWVIPDYTFFIISPDGRNPYEHDDRVVALKDSDVIANINDIDFKDLGWWKQQAIKIAMAPRLTSDTVLILDADCFMLKPLPYADIFTAEGKIRTRKYGTSWDNWYGGSRAILGKEINPALIPSQRIDVTPTILSRHILQSLNTWIERTHGWDWMFYNILPRPKTHPDHAWTEYCLYHLHALETDLWDKYHEFDDFYLYGNCYWNPQQADEWDPTPSFANPDFYFTVAQSIGHKPASWVWNKIRQYVTGPKVYNV